MIVKVLVPGNETGPTTLSHGRFRVKIYAGKRQCRPSLANGIPTPRDRRDILCRTRTGGRQSLRFACQPRSRAGFQRGSRGLKNVLQRKRDSSIDLNASVAQTSPCLSPAVSLHPAIRRAQQYECSAEIFERPFKPLLVSWSLQNVSESMYVEKTKNYLWLCLISG